MVRGSNIHFKNKATHIAQLHCAIFLMYYNNLHRSVTINLFYDIDK